MNIWVIFHPLCTAKKAARKTNTNNKHLIIYTFRRKRGKECSMHASHTHLFKCILLGHPGVGKTSLANRVASGKFIDCPLATFTEASVVKRVDLPSGRVVSLDLWDTAGQERYRSLTLSYFRNTKAVLLLYDAENKIKIVDWLKEVQRHMTRGEALVFLVGTKLDLGSEVRLTEGEVQGLTQVAGDREMDIAGHFALSSKTGQNVAETLLGVAQTLLKAVEEKRLDVSGKQGTLRLWSGNSRSSRSAKCCT